MTRPFQYLFRVRYGECDAQKVVFNARYGDYIELATTEFMRALGFGAELADGRLDYQLVRQLIEWSAPARFDDVIRAQPALLRIGTTSFSLKVHFERAADDKPLAHAETTYVVVGPNVVKQPVPQVLRDALERGAPSVVTDHAGWHDTPG